MFSNSANAQDAFGFTRGVRLLLLFREAWINFLLFGGSYYSMKCTTCQTEILEGYLKANGRSVKWFFDQQGWLAKFLADGQAITDLWGKVRGSYCAKCNVITLSEVTLQLPKA